MPTITLILETIRAICLLGTEFLKYYQTPAGQAQVNKMLADQAALDKWWNSFLTNAEKFFKGELFKIPNVPHV